VGLYHLAWQVDTIDELAEIRTRMMKAGSFGGESDHGVSKSVYGHDPDGIEFEVMWMVPESDWGSYAVDAVVAPLDLQAEISRWSGVSTRV
jgi:catechol-2,3-dioxygenase